MEISQYAPVLIPTLNRFEHFKRCVTSLSKCTHAEKTDLFIVLDYPLKEEHWEGYRKIKEFLKTLEGLKTIEIIERDRNYGAVDNIKQAREYIFSKYDRIILSEDDNEFSPNFLDYINKGLDKFEDDPKILGICGYSFPDVVPSSYMQNYYFYPRLSAWGYGTWKSKISNKKWNKDKIKDFLSTKSSASALKYYAEKHYYKVCSAIKNNNALIGDQLAILDAIENKAYFAYPVLSKVRNHGHDGSGIHCGVIEGNNKYKNQEIDGDREFTFLGNINSLESKLVEHYRRTLKVSLKTKIKLIIKKIIW